MIEWLLKEIEMAEVAKEDAWNEYVVSYLFGKIDAYKEVLNYISERQKESVEEK